MLRVEGGFGPELVDPIIDSYPEGSVVALIDRDIIYDERHLGSAFMHAARALNEGEGRARDPSLEVIRWLTGSRQVGRAIEIAGPRGEDVFIAAVAPHGWPQIEDWEDLPKIAMTGNGPDVFSDGRIGIVDPGDGDHFGGEKSLDRLGIEKRDGIPDSGFMGIMELVACTNLK